MFATLVQDISPDEEIRPALATPLLTPFPPQLLILDEPTNHLDLTHLTPLLAYY